MKRYKSAFAVPSGFCVATRAVAATKVGSVSEKAVGVVSPTAAGSRSRQSSAATVADRAA